jgi:hypothetical protein
MESLDALLARRLQEEEHNETDNDIRHIHQRHFHGGARRLWCGVHTGNYADRDLDLSYEGLLALGERV